MVAIDCFYQEHMDNLSMLSCYRVLSHYPITQWEVFLQKCVIPFKFSSYACIINFLPSSLVIIKIDFSAHEVYT